VGAGTAGVVGKAAGLSGGGAKVSGVGRVAATEAGSTGGGGGTAAAFTGGAVIIGGGGAGITGGALTSIGFTGSAGFGAITAVAAGVLMAAVVAGGSADGAFAGMSSCGDKCAMTTFATTPTATA